MSDADFSALATSWHDFYLTAGAAAATLIGLLFVGISINLDEFTTDAGTGIRVLAEQAFANFVFVLVIALLVLIPQQNRSSMTLDLAIVGTVGHFGYCAAPSHSAAGRRVRSAVGGTSCAVSDCRRWRVWA